MNIHKICSLCAQIKIKNKETKKNHFKIRSEHSILFAFAARKEVKVLSSPRLVSGLELG